MKRTVVLLKASMLILAGAIACGSEEFATMAAPDRADEYVVPQEGLPETILSKFHDNVEAYIDGDMIVLRSTGVPNHGSPYFDTDHELFEQYNGTNTEFRLNPNGIEEQDYTFRIPLNPVEAGFKEATPLGPIGIAVNGVPFFNQYAGPDQPLTAEINSFDHYNGHPARAGNYHYHIEPLHLTENIGRDAFLGILLDGFPVYGPEENGVTITNDDLDAYHGHFGVTAEYPDGIYHYHVTDEDPYINGSGFFGEAGTVTQ